MPFVCAVFGCTRTTGCHKFEDDGITPLNFFRFPSSTSKTFKLWVASCGRKDLKEEEYGSRVVCSRHFDPTSIRGNRITRPRLDPDAKPVANLPNNSCVATLTADSSPMVKEEPIATNSPVHRHVDPNPLVKDSNPPKSLHPIQDINNHNPLWNVRISDVIWYVHVDVNNNAIPAVVHSVKVSTTEKYIKFFVGTVEIEQKIRMTIMGHFDFRILDHFLAILERFYSRKHIVHHLSDVVNDISVMLRGEIESEAESTRPADSEGFCDDPSALLFIKEQLKMYLLSPYGRRWTPAVLRLALILYFHSPEAYRSIYHSGSILLPSEKTLTKYIGPEQAQPGLYEENMTRLNIALNELDAKDKHMQLLKKPTGKRKLEDMQSNGI